MTPQPKVRPFDLHTITGSEYDLFIGTIGYEHRARYIPEHLKIRAAQRIAVGFESDQIYNYEENSLWYRSANFEIYHLGDEPFGRLLAERLTNIARKPKGRDAVRLCVDISSMTRIRMAMLMRLLADARLGTCLEADFLYATASFSPPPSSSVPNRHVGPVLPSFSGWWTAPERPLAAAVGLGYEENKALGAVEHIQASSIWTFQPISPIDAYTPALDQANRTLLNLVPSENKFNYRVDRPFDGFVELESFTFGITRNHNLVLLPFGPKIFALCALMVGLLHPEVAVWRVSGAEEPADRRASGDVCGLGISIAASAKGIENEDLLHPSRPD
jgi:hypothetical protein